MFKRLSSHSLIILLGSLVWLVLSYYNLLVDDDVVMLRSVKDAGIVGATIGQYETWNTRWMSFFFLHTWMNFWNENSSPLLYHLATLVALVLASRRLVMAMISKRCIVASSGLQEWTFAGLISTALVVASYHIGDTWFWVNTSTMYGWNLIALLLAMSLVLSPLKNKLLQDILLTFCGLYIGGAAEPAVVCLGLMLPAYLYLDRKRSKTISPHIINFLIGMAVSFGIALAGDGHGKREAALPDPGMLGLLIKGAYFSAKMALYHTPLRMLMVLVILFPLFAEHKKNSHFLPVTLKAAGAWFAVVIFHTYLITYIMGDYGPERAWSFISFCNVMIAGWWLYHCSGILNVMLMKILSWGVCMVMAFTLFKQLNTLPVYHAYVKSISTKEVNFDPEKVPDSGLLHKVTMGMD
jgi:hypothetical protein